MNSLTQLANKYGTDKGSVWFNNWSPKYYTEAYYDLLARYREEKVTLLELGIASGGSLKMWRDFFVNGKIIGLDIKPGCLKYYGERIEVYIGDCGNKKFLESNFKNLEFDFVIDDASHRKVPTIAAYEYLRPKTNKYYFIENTKFIFGLGSWLYKIKNVYKLKKDLAIIPCQNQS